MNNAPTSSGTNAITKYTETQYAIMGELATLILSLGGDMGATVGLLSWGDTLTDEETLKVVRDYNLRFKRLV